MRLEKLLMPLTGSVILSAVLGGCTPSTNPKNAILTSNPKTVSTQQEQTNPQLSQEQKPEYTSDDFKITYNEWEEAIENPEGPED